MVTRVRTSFLALAVMLLSAVTVASHGATSPRDAVTDHLLAVDRFPAVAERTWSVDTAGPEGGTTVGHCQKSALESLGATHAVRRTLVAADGFSAVQVVGEFADARSAWRIQQVLVAWRDDCESRVSGARVGRLRDVAVTTGTGASYRGAFGPDRSAAGLGILRTGRFLVLLEVSGPREHYPTGWDPARVALRRVARTF